MLCEQCRREFKDQRRLSQHVRWHDRKYRCMYEKCREKQGFACKKDLTRHEQTHAEMKDIRQCPYCKCNIGRWDNLGKHIYRTHKDNLPVAAASGDEAAVKLLLEDGGDAKPKDTDLNATLILATAKGHAGIVNLLLDNGADIEAEGDPAWSLRAIATTPSGSRLAGSWTPLAVASRYGHEDIVRALLQRKATTNPNRGQPPLVCAAMHGHTRIVELLLEAGAAVDLVEGWTARTALSHAAENGQEAVVKLLIDADANVNARHKTQSLPPSSWAARNGHVAVVKFLLDHGADMSLSAYGRMPRDCATSNGHEAVARVLQNFSAERVKQNGGLYIYNSDASD